MAHYEMFVHILNMGSEATTFIKETKENLKSLTGKLAEKLQVFVSASAKICNLKVFLASCLPDMTFCNYIRVDCFLLQIKFHSSS